MGETYLRDPVRVPLAGVQPQQDPGVPSGETASASARERQRMTRGDQASVSKARSFIFRRSFYTLSCIEKIIGGAKSCKVSSP